MEQITVDKIIFCQWWMGQNAERISNLTMDERDALADFHWNSLCGEIESLKKMDEGMAKVAPGASIKLKVDSYPEFIVDSSDLPLYAHSRGVHLIARMGPHA